MQERTAHQAVVMDKVDRDAEATAERGEEVVATEAEEGEEEPLSSEGRFVLISCSSLSCLLHSLSPLRLHQQGVVLETVYTISGNGNMSLVLPFHRARGEGQSGLVAVADPK
jgi:hypothetical protein